MTISRRRTLFVLLSGAVAVLAVGFGSRAQAEDLRIGLIAPTTGIFAAVGKEMTDGFQMYLDTHKGELGGAKVKLIIEDSVGKPDVAVTKMRKVILQDKVHMVIGGVLASEGYAMAPVSSEYKTLYISSVQAADDLTQRELSKYDYFIRTSWTSSQPSHPFGQWACDQGFKTIAAIGADYAFGYEVIGGFQKAFEDCGGKIIQKIWVPIGAKDFGPYIPVLKTSADRIFSLMVGPSALQFPKQVLASGYRKPMIGGGVSYDEFTLPAMGDEVIGHIAPLQYSAALETPKNEAFVKMYRAKYGKVPSYFSESNYTTAQMIDELIKEGRRQVPRRAGIHQATIGDEVRRGARAGQLRRHAQSGAEHLHQEGREEEAVRLRQGRALERGDQDLSERQPVLDLRQGDVSQAAGLQPRLPAMQILRVTLDDHPA